MTDTITTSIDLDREVYAFCMEFDYSICDHTL